MSNNDNIKKIDIIDIDKLDALIDFFETKGINELEIENKGMRIRLKKEDKAYPYREIISSHHLSPAKEKDSCDSDPSAAKNKKGDEVAELEGHPVKSPIVGTFYMASSPTSEPLVKKGDIVEKGQILCIIEAMKIMNEIESDIKGKIVAILVEDGHPVEYGEPLFLIEPL